MVQISVGLVISNLYISGRHLCRSACQGVAVAGWWSYIIWRPKATMLWMYTTNSYWTPFRFAMVCQPFVGSPKVHWILKKTQRYLLAKSSLFCLAVHVAICDLIPSQYIGRFHDVSCCYPGIYIHTLHYITLHTHTYIHACMHTYIHYLHTYIHTHTHIYIHIYAHITCNFWIFLI